MSYTTEVKGGGNDDDDDDSNDNYKISVKVHYDRVDIKTNRYINIAPFIKHRRRFVQYNAIQYNSRLLEISKLTRAETV